MAIPRAPFPGGEFRPVGLRIYPQRGLLCPYDVQSGENLAGVVDVHVDQELNKCSHVTIKFRLRNDFAIVVEEEASDGQS